ncbi:MAG: biopolymer transporter ExbD [candidate division Zixibacteria bacterium]|nr:biopolymer transporter ExbD [candidate division Zixibacteria bacterium]
MGAVDVPQKESKQKKGGGGLKRPKKRIGIRIDMTPMVDIAFLLLIFYMVTTVFSMPQSMEVNLPPKDSIVKPQNIKRSRLLEVMVDADANIFWMHTPPGTEPMELPQYIEMDKFRQLIIDKNQEIAKLVIVLRIDPKCHYEMMVNIIDDIQVTERLFKQADPEWSQRFSLQDLTEWEFQLMEQAKAAMGIGQPVAEEAGGTS